MFERLYNNKKTRHEDFQRKHTGNDNAYHEKSYHDNVSITRIAFHDNLTMTTLTLATYTMTTLSASSMAVLTLT